MNDKHTATYLNDHLAGSVVALELLSRLGQDRAGTEEGAFAAELHREISSDRDELMALMAKLSVPVNQPRRAAAWLGEKMTQLKLRLDDSGGGPLHLLKVLETVALGVEGKRMLWRSLAAAAEISPRLQGPEYGILEQRAVQQRERLEHFRLRAAKGALGAGG
jgi:hypothetical protein